MRNDLAAKLGAAHWDLWPLWSIAPRVDRKNEGLVEQNLLSLSYGRVIRKGIGEAGGLRPESYETYNIVEPGDVVLRMTDLQNDQKSIRTGFVSEPGIITSAYVTVRPNPAVVEPRFLAAVLRAYDSKKVFYEMGSGVRQTLKYGELGQIPVPLPDLTIQRTIVEYLDSETGEIDAMIGKLDDLAELLVARRDRAIESLLEALPEDTKWVPSKFLVRIQTGSGDTKDATEDGTHPFYVRSQTPLAHHDWEFEGDAVLTAGDGAGVGKVFHFVRGKFMAHQRVYVLNEFDGVLPAYYFHMFKHLFPAVALDGTAKATVDSVRLRMIADLRVPVPSLEDQCIIADHLDEVTLHNDTMLNKVAMLKELLTERRAALITDVVTGRKEVA